MMVAKVCEYTEKHWIVYFERVNFMACESFLNKTVKYIFKNLFGFEGWIQINYLFVFELFEFVRSGILTFILIHEDL